MVTIGRIPWVVTFCKSIQRCRLGQLSVETQRAFQPIGPYTANRLYSTALIGTPNSLHLIHRFSVTGCSIGSISMMLIKYNNNYKIQAQFNTGNEHLLLQCNHSQFHCADHTRKLLKTNAVHVPSTFRDDHNPERRSSPMEIEEVVEYLHEENANDICVIRIPPSLDYVDYFVVCSGFGARHLRRMADGLVAEMKSVRIGRNNRRVRVEGQDCDDWMAVEMGTIVVHFMMEEARSKYELEKLWTLGPRYDDQYRTMEHILENNP